LARLVHTRCTEARLADAREADEAAVTPVLAAAIRADVEGRRRELREKYGAAEADDLLDRVSRFKQQDARLPRLLDTRGVGWSHEVFALLIDHVRRVNFR